jgi:C1A family cysteine protease
MPTSAIKIAGYGWLPDLPDHRDQHFSPAGHVLTALPPKVDLRPDCPPVLNQGQKIGSCTAHAVCNAHRYNQMQESSEHFLPSRLFVHYNARVMIGTQRQNHGAQIRDAIKSIAQQGVCHESAWPYKPAKYATKPTPAAYRQALQHRALRYHRIQQDLNHLRACLAEGFPFVLGLTVYESFESDKVGSSGRLEMPRKKESLVGGHAVLAVGYDDRLQRFTVMNSWGRDWGKHGYFTVPYSYLLESNLAADFWTIRNVAV